MTSTDDIADQAPGVIGRKLAGRVALVTGGTRGIGGVPSRGAGPAHHPDPLRAARAA